MDKPWNIVLYSDEVGVSPLKVDTRKTEAVYWTFMELGVQALSDEDAWFAIAAPRSTITAQTGASVSTLIKALWPAFFGKDGHDIAKSGMFLQLCGGNETSHMLFAAFQFLVCDERGHKYILGCKGSGGTKPCFSA